MLTFKQFNEAKPAHQRTPKALFASVAEKHGYEHIPGPIGKFGIPDPGPKRYVHSEGHKIVVTAKGNKGEATAEHYTKQSSTHGGEPVFNKQNFSNAISLDDHLSELHK